MNERRLSRLFPNGSKSFIKLNRDPVDDSRMSCQPESMDKQEMGENKRNQTKREEYSLKHVNIEFFAEHGKVMDSDNREYIAKTYIDALVQLGFSQDDKEVHSSVKQATKRMDKDNNHI